MAALEGPHWALTELLGAGQALVCVFANWEDRSVEVGGGSRIRGDMAGP